MDAGAFLQENKRWLLGCVLGGLVFVIGRVVIGTIWDPAALPRVPAVTGPLYDNEAGKTARAEAEALHAERQKLEADLRFKPDERFQLEGKPLSPDVYLGQVGRSLKQQILQQANQLEVTVYDKDLAWPSPTGTDDIRAVLFGLDLVQEVAQRLFQAHQAVRTADAEAPGLRAIQSLRLDDRRTGRSQPRTLKPGEVDLREHLDQERVTFGFQSDFGTALAFLDRLRKPGKTLVLETLTITPSGKPGEPVAVKGTLLGLAFKTAGNDDKGAH